MILRQAIINIPALWRRKKPKRTSPLGGAEYVAQLFKRYKSERMRKTEYKMIEAQENHNTRCAREKTYVEKSPINV
jgi:hypothetical protein